MWILEIPCSLFRHSVPIGNKSAFSASNFVPYRDRRLYLIMITIMHEELIKFVKNSVLLTSFWDSSIIFSLITYFKHQLPRIFQSSELKEQFFDLFIFKIWMNFLLILFTSVYFRLFFIELILFFARLRLNQSNPRNLASRNQTYSWFLEVPCFLLSWGVLT